MMKMRILVAACAALVAVPAQSADVAKGEQLAQAQCAACHGKDFFSPVDPSYPKLAGQYPDYLEKALRDSDLGINPTSDGTVIRVSFPQLTEERRREYTKVAKHKAEEARVSVRNIRRHAKDGLDKLQKDGEAGEDDVRRAEKHLDELTHKRVDHIDEILKHKEAELLEV